MTARGVKAPPLAAIFGCAGPRLLLRERDFFHEVDPAGFILFSRNVESPAQLNALVAALRDSVGRPDALVLIDQEGGRVARLRPPHWRAVPAAARFGELAQHDMENGRKAAWLNARLLADDLAVLGISVDCLPVLDLRIPGAHDIVGDRSYGADPDLVSALAGAVCEGLMDGGVLPIVKHIPGHGRATVDSHHELPIVAAERELLEISDFMPFRRLSGMPLAMTAHIVYQAVDPDCPATTSARVINEIIRGSIGFGGLLLTDDLSMKALGGSLGERAANALAAGCDIVLHCNGDSEEMRQIAGAAGRLDGNALKRYRDAMSAFRPPRPFDRPSAEAELATLMGLDDKAW
ncbi:MAG: beta-N-acetylhexosaminidase [Rhodospirillales bacterium]|nr:MAG: beta-N-acetylhexosaminidase [Rhodospirillales bacterium]